MLIAPIGLRVSIEVVFYITIVANDHQKPPKAFLLWQHKVLIYHVMVLQGNAIYLHWIGFWAQWTIWTTGSYMVFDKPSTP